MNVFVCAIRLVGSKRRTTVFFIERLARDYSQQASFVRLTLEGAHQKPRGQTNGGTSTKKEYYTAIKTNDVIT